MDIYHSWIYIHVINTKYFIWTIILTTVFANVLGPIILWFIINGKPMWKPKKQKKKN